MTITAKSRVLAVLGAVALVIIAACADAATGPVVTGQRAPRDSSTGIIQGDTLECRSGWIIVHNQYECL